MANGWGAGLKGELTIEIERDTPDFPTETIAYDFEPGESEMEKTRRSTGEPGMKMDGSPGNDQTSSGPPTTRQDDLLKLELRSAGHWQNEK